VCWTNTWIIKHSKCVVNQKLDFDDISFRELFGGMRVWFFTHTKKKICPLIKEGLNIVVMKRKFKQWWLTIPTISTQRTIASHFSSLNIKYKETTTYDVGNPGPGLGQVSWWKFYQNYLKCFQCKFDYFGNFLLIQYVYSHCQISHLKSNVSN
jgi:hypothetical protein